MTYGKAREADHLGDISNSFVTMNLGEGLWVNVPNMVRESKRGKQLLYAFSLDPGYRKPMVRIVANYINIRKQMVDEPVDFRRSNEFVPETGYQLRFREYPHVLTRTFSILGLGIGNVESLLDEQSKAIEQGWLCRVADNLKDIMPSPQVFKNIAGAQL